MGEPTGLEFPRKQETSMADLMMVILVAFAAGWIAGLATREMMYRRSMADLNREVHAAYEQVSSLRDHKWMSRQAD